MYAVKLQNISCKRFPHMELLGIDHILRGIYTELCRVRPLEWIWNWIGIWPGS